MVLNIFAHIAHMVHEVNAAHGAVSMLMNNSKSFRYRQGEVASYWRTAAEHGFKGDHAMMMKFKTLRWVPADSTVEANRSYQVITGTIGTYAPVRTNWDYSLV